MSTKKAKSAKPAKKAKAAEVTTPREQRNGVTRPADDTVCGKVWAALDKIKTDGGKAVASEVIEKLKDINPATARTQAQRWRVFHGA